jgi:D-arabinan exo alpha-(1,3)/(1,5)-arabinofuranosidase (non-reducing end)
MRKTVLLSLACLFLATFASSIISAQELSGSLSNLTMPQDYVLKRVSSYDRTGGNADRSQIEPGQTLTLVDEDGPGVITHVWFTIASGERFHLKKLVLRMYWDGERTPSVETPVGDFFGLGLGDYFLFESDPLKVGANNALNSFFPMPFPKHARMTVTNEGQRKVDAFYFNIDYRAYAHPLAADTLYFHAQYRQATPNTAVKSDGKNLKGEDNYVWMTANGRGHFVGVTMSVLENADGWWGEGDDMFFVDGEKLPSINGTGTEDYFLGAWDFGGKEFAYGSFGAPVVGPERAGARWSVYRFHLDSPIPFTKSLRATIEHGHANDRGDDFYSVAYWYQTEPHAAFPPLPPAESRVPQLHPAAGK